MKKLEKLQKKIIDWLSVFPKLAYEIILFILKTPYYFYLFFHGLRITSVSYAKLLNGISSRKKSIDNLFQAKLDAQKTTHIFRALLNDTIELNKEQEKLFTGLFGIFIAILALFISIIALLLSKK